MYVYQMTELAIKTSERYPHRIEFIRSIHIIVNDQIGQAPAKFDNMVDNIFKVVCSMNVHKEKNLLATYDPTKSIYGDPFCYYMLQKTFLSKILSAHNMIIF